MARYDIARHDMARHDGWGRYDRKVPWYPGIHASTHARVYACTADTHARMHSTPACVHNFVVTAGTRCTTPRLPPHVLHYALGSGHGSFLGVAMAVSWEWPWQFRTAPRLHCAAPHLHRAAPRRTLTHMCSVSAAQSCREADAPRPRSAIVSVQMPQERCVHVHAPVCVRVCCGCARIASRF